MSVDPKSVTHTDSQPVQWLEFRFQIADERGDLQRVAGDALTQILRQVTASVRVNVFHEPVFEQREFAAAEGGIEVVAAEVDACPFHELCCEQVAERVRGEVAEAAETPVNVLQATFAVRWWREVE